jgi:hypothetical protein
MKTKQQLEQQVEEALHALDGAEKAIPKPFLLTRIHARVHAKQETIWDKCLYFISRPAIAIIVVGIVIALNVLVVANGTKTEDAFTDEVQNGFAADDEEVAANTLILYNENIEP